MKGKIEKPKTNPKEVLKIIVAVAIELLKLLKE